MKLLTIDDLAAMLSLDRRYVRDKLVKRPDFPLPAVSLSQKVRLWKLEDVTAWIG